MSDSNDKLFFHWSESSQKFDYYAVGLVATAVVYLAGKYEPARLGWNPATIDLLAIVALLIAFFAGLIRLQMTVTILRVTNDLVAREARLTELKGRRLPDAAATAEQLANETLLAKSAAALPGIIAKAKKKRDELAAACAWAYAVRDVGLMLGMSFMVLSKFAAAYLLS